MWLPVEHCVHCVIMHASKRWSAARRDSWGYRRRRQVQDHTCLGGVLSDENSCIFPGQLCWTVPTGRIRQACNGLGVRNGVGIISLGGDELRSDSIWLAVAEDKYLEIGLQNPKPCAPHSRSPSLRLWMAGPSNGRRRGCCGRCTGAAM